MTPYVPEPSETVVLVHGLWMHGLILASWQHWFKKEGFAARRLSYPSWSRNLEWNADVLENFIADTPGSSIHLVCHSLGGLIALVLLERRRDARIRRLVLMGTPVADCHCGRFLADKTGLAPILGRSMGDWLARTKPAIPKEVEIGIVAGTRRLGLGCIIPGLERPNDGVVSVAETRLAEAKDHLILPVSHSGMLFSPTCVRQAAHFLRTGEFLHGR